MQKRKSVVDDDDERRRSDDDRDKADGNFAERARTLAFPRSPTRTRRHRSTRAKIQTVRKRKRETLGWKRRLRREARARFLFRECFYPPVYALGVVVRGHGRPKPSPKPQIVRGKCKGESRVRQTRGFVRVCVVVSVYLLKRYHRTFFSSHTEREKSFTSSVKIIIKAPRENERARRENPFRREQRKREKREHF